jgi:hypothetical protein
MGLSGNKVPQSPVVNKHLQNGKFLKLYPIFRHACMGLSQILEHHHALQSLVFLTNMFVDWDIIHFENKHNEQDTSLQVTRPLQRAMYWMISYGCNILIDRVLFETF